MDLISYGISFDENLKSIRNNHPHISWYPYDTLSCLGIISLLLPLDTVKAIDSGDFSYRVLDVGAADGSLGFLLESRGARVDFLDNESTNFNRLLGIRTYKESLQSRATIITQDVDRSFNLDDTYDVTFALGILYHLRNPMGFLMTLAHHSESLILSTRVATHLPDGTRVDQSPIGYLLRSRESNGDSTNFWTFTPLGLETLLKRSGWRMRAKHLAGNTTSNPTDIQHDQRMFVYCTRVPNWNELWLHHDF